MLYKDIDNKLAQIQEVGFSNEKELQTLCEENLETLLSLEFIATEFSVDGFRIDTFAYDKEANSFILIEYKNTKIHSVVDQGVAYLAAMLKQKAHFILKFSQRRNKVYDVKDINWAQSKVIFISPHFTSYQMGAVNFQGMPIELWKIKKYENDTISFEQVGAAESSKNSDSDVKISEFMPIEDRQVIKEIQTYNEEDLVAYGSPTVQDLYASFKEFISLEKEELKVRATKFYVGFYKNRNCLISIEIQKKSLVIWMNEKFCNVNDPQNIVQDYTMKGKAGNGDCRIQISDDTHIGYIQDLIRKFLANR